MASTISAGTTSGTALNMSGDTSGNLAFQTSAGTYTQTMPNATGTVMVSGNMPAFSAYNNSGGYQTITTAVTKVILNAKVFDTNNNFDSTTNSRFTPTVAGYYQFSGSVGGNVSTELLACLFKNGSLYTYGSDGTLYISNFSVLVYMNGSTDYVELYAYSPALANNIYQAQARTYFTGSLVRAA